MYVTRETPAQVDRPLRTVASTMNRYLAGTLTDRRLVFRYCQVDTRGDVHGGRSVCDVNLLADGRVRLLEHFEWESREGSGTNVLEQVVE